MFYLVRLDPEGETPLPDYGPYEAGPDAAKEAKALTDKLGVKVQPRRMRQAPDWKARQQRRLDSGELKPLPPEWDLVPIPDHFAHISAKNPRLIAFTETEEQGILDRVTVIKPGAYLGRYYPDLRDPFDGNALREKLGREPFTNEIDAEWNRLKENARKRYAGLIARDDGLFFATTPDEIEWVYESGTEERSDEDEGKEHGTLVSCMTRAWHSTGKFLTPIHPVRVYGAGDLAIAYTLSKSGKVSERCICWPDKSLYGRIYSDGSGRLKKTIEEAGFRPWSNADMHGARLIRCLFKQNGQDYFVCPHIDGGLAPGQGALKVRDMGDHLVIDGTGPMASGTTAGMIPAVIATHTALGEAA